MRLFRRQQQPSENVQQPALNQTATGLGPRMSKARTNIWLGLVILVFVMLALLAGGLLWYQKNTAPLDPGAGTRTFMVEQGDPASLVAARLERQGFIRSSLAFKMALWFNGAATSIKPGEYKLSAAMSVHKIIVKLRNGAPRHIVSFTIIPGESLIDIREKLRELGYSKTEIQQALLQEYKHPALRFAPEEASLEGYLYPDTYRIALGKSPAQLVRKALDNFHRHVKAKGLYNAFGKPGLTFHEAVIMASIVEKEVNKPKDRPKVAQVFLKRLELGMQLGADSTFVYAAEKLGVEPRVKLRSPYNTRIHAGLPPGPIANFTIDALMAVAHPADTEYLYFVTGDNNVTHYAKTAAGHRRNVEKYCGDRCEL